MKKKSGPPKNKEKIGPGPLKIGFLTPRGSRGGAGGPRSDFEKIKNLTFYVGPLDPYKPPFNPINRPWDPSRWHTIEKILHFAPI